MLSLERGLKVIGQSSRARSLIAGAQKSMLSRRSLFRNIGFAFDPWTGEVLVRSQSDGGPSLVTPPWLTEEVRAKCAETLAKGNQELMDLKDQWPIKALGMNQDWQMVQSWTDSKGIYHEEPWCGIGSGTVPTPKAKA